MNHTCQRKWSDKSSKFDWDYLRTKYDMIKKKSKIRNLQDQVDLRSYTNRS